MIKNLLRVSIVGLVAIFSYPAQAYTCPGSTSFTTLANGTVANATQVMDNFYYLLCNPILTGDVAIQAPNANISGLGDGRYLTIRGVGSSPGSADARIELTNPNSPANGYLAGEVLFLNEGNGGDKRVARVYAVTAGTGGAGGFGGQLAFETKKDTTAAYNGIYMDQNGGFYPGSDNAQVLGISSRRWSVVYAANGTIQTSDARLKRDIRMLTSGDGLDAIGRLHPVTFKWKQESGASFRHYGFVAQEVQKILPDIVDVGDDPQHTLGLNYQAFIPSIVMSIQQLDARSRQTAEIANIALTRTRTSLKRDAVAVSEILQKQQKLLDQQQKKIDQLQKQISQLKHSRYRRTAEN